MVVGLLSSIVGRRLGSWPGVFWSGVFWSGVFWSGVFGRPGLRPGPEASGADRAAWSPPRRRSPSYGGWSRRVQPVGGAVVPALALTGVLALGLALPAGATGSGGTGAGAEGRPPLRIVALGDSLVAGYGLPPGEAFPVRLQQALAANGRSGGRTVEIVNAGVSGDTASDGLARLDWAVGDDADAVLVELGANDALRGIDPAVTRKALDEILRRLAARGLPVLLVGMQAPPNMGPAYKQAFDAIYPELAQTHGVPLVPFFLDGVAAERALNQRDGIHPNADGVRIIVSRMLPQVEDLVARAAARRDRS